MPSSWLHIVTPRLIATAFLAVVAASPLQARGRYSELVLTFPSERTLRYEANEADNSLTLVLPDSAPEELEPLQHYDERLIKRVLVTDLGPQGSEVKLVLKDRNVRATLDTLREPFRLVISLFDKDYTQERDPSTNLPLAGVGVAAASSLAAAPGETLLEPEHAPASPSDAQPQQNPGMRRLLQPTPDLARNSDELSALLNKTSEGRGKAWADYPIYIYPLQIAAFQGRKEPAGWRKKASSEAMASAQAMAEFALHLYSFGHEGRALVAYQQVLHTDSSVFSKDPLHLWAFAESHFGHGNLTLADGYYQMLVTKFPESPLAKHASMRRLDVAAIRMTKAGQWEKLPGLIPNLQRIDTRPSAEQRALNGIRQTFWQHAKALSPQQVLPLVDAEVRPELTSALPAVESQRTALLAASLLLYTAVQPSTPWQTASGVMAGEYFSKYSEATAHPFYHPLKEALHSRLQHVLQGLAQEGRYTEAVTTFEALPAILRTLAERPEVAWALAESYRNIGQEAAALTHYQVAANKSAAGIGRFKAYFWSALLASRLVRSGRSQRANPGRIAGYQRTAATADERMARSWDGLKDDEKQAVQTAYKPHFEAALSEDNRLVTPPRLILASWTAALSTRLDTPASSSGSDAASAYSPTAASVRLLRDLAARFGALGLQRERREAIKLLKGLNPANFSGDQEAKRIWSEQLTRLADEYRQANEFLEAGRLYTFTAENNSEMEDRAESLYKGGLLLYRAGKREEAIKAFTSASQDGNNLFYANLAKERLTQLQP